MGNIKKYPAFTILELILVVALLAILVAVIFIGINPAQRIAEGRNTSRLNDLKEIASGIYEYSLANDGQMPPGLNNTYQLIGSDTDDCTIACNSLSQEVGGGNALEDGSYLNAQWNDVASLAELTSAGLAAGSGSYVSSIIDAQSEVDWQNLSWITLAPYTKQLPDNNAIENSYSSNNLDMSGNVLLLHLNEQSGTIQDTSGHSNNGTSSNITYGINGKYNSAVGCNGISSNISISNNASLQLTNEMTMEAWVYTTTNKSAKIFQKGDWDGFGLYQDSWNGWSFAVNFQAGGGANVKWTNGIPTANRWYHLVGTYDGANLRLYVDGQLTGTNTGNGPIRVTTRPISLGSDNGNQKFFSGGIDEAALYNRVLSAQEVLARFNRGSQRVKLQVRSCDDVLCSGENFSGPGGIGSYYTELNNSSLDTPSFALNNVPSNRYFQFRMVLETDSIALNPQVSTVNISRSGAVVTGAGETAATCIDLESLLVPDVLAKMPYDIMGGSLGKTHYAVAVVGSNRVRVVSCNAELGEEILVEK